MYSMNSQKRIMTKNKFKLDTLNKSSLTYDIQSTARGCGIHSGRKNMLTVGGDEAYIG